ncbi:hypothetical protein DdX_12279 [Ditylenchus destructor]|uniref:Uncharacterized protein n=1 Tax=Ditylenchus destructor TaxID=166010 RepID=A0AAD4R0J5_9BILA|nr:hypothetical protein DdX_12279 [Ditylenchus destructor]
MARSTPFLVSNALFAYLTIPIIPAPIYLRLSYLCAFHSHHKRNIGPFTGDISQQHLSTPIVLYFRVLSDHLSWGSTPVILRALL